MTSFVAQLPAIRLYVQMMPNEHMQIFIEKLIFLWLHQYIVQVILFLY